MRPICTEQPVNSTNKQANKQQAFINQFMSKNGTKK